MIRRSLAIATVAFGVALAAPLTALAYPAQTTGNLNVRAGPGVGHARVGVLPRHVVINVRFCQSRWCQIDFRGGVAWASASYLRAAYAPAPGPRYRSRRAMRPYFDRRSYPGGYYGMNPYYRRPGVSIYFGTRFGPWIGF